MPIYPTCPFSKITYPLLSLGGVHTNYGRFKGKVNNFKSTFGLVKIISKEF